MIRRLFDFCRLRDGVFAADYAFAGPIDAHAQIPIVARRWQPVGDLTAFLFRPVVDGHGAVLVEFHRTVVQVGVFTFKGNRSSMNSYAYRRSISFTNLGVGL